MLFCGYIQFSTHCFYCRPAFLVFHHHAPHDRTIRPKMDPARSEAIDPITTWRQRCTSHSHHLLLSRRTSYGHHPSPFRECASCDCTHPCSGSVRPAAETHSHSGSALPAAATHSFSSSARPVAAICPYSSGARPVAAIRPTSGGACPVATISPTSGGAHPIAAISPTSGGAHPVAAISPCSGGVHSATATD